MKDRIARALIDWSFSDSNAPEEVRRGGHGTTEYCLIRGFVNSIDNDPRPPIDAVKAVDMTLPGLIAHEAAF